MNRKAALAGFILAGAVATPPALSFCGFYVAQGDEPLVNKASKVVLARDGNRTTLTMSNDYKGKASEFAIVVPVPTVLNQDQIRVVESALIDRVDQYTIPRMAEYFDPDPCYVYEDSYRAKEGRYPRPTSAPMPPPEATADASYRVTIEATYDVGEYDILILSAEDSSGLERWLHDNHYNIPTGASAILGSYIKQNLKFFVAKVDLKELAKLEQPFLRPIQVEYESPKFMLPIRLGMVNADGPQDLLIYALTPTGRVETTNYRTTKLPTDLNVPPYVQSEFKQFYGSMFDKQVAKQGMSTVFTEYAWPLTVVCDPCSAEMLGPQDLQPLGADWSSDYHGGINGGFVTRLHVRYDLSHFPEDLVFQETADSSTYQARYVVNHPFEGDTSCAAGRDYEVALADRQQGEVANLTELTGWDPSEIRTHIPKRANAPKPKTKSWWEQQ